LIDEKSSKNYQRNENFRGDLKNIPKLFLFLLIMGFIGLVAQTKWPRKFKNFL